MQIKSVKFITYNFNEYTWVYILKKYIFLCINFGFI